MTLPRVLVAAPASGHGKTTIATALAVAAHLAGLKGDDYVRAIAAMTPDQRNRFMAS